jgi:serine/threonine protein kinase
MLSRTGDVKVGDFGIAKAAGRAIQTQSGVLKGKIPYMSPEQAHADPIDKRSDQFSLAAVLWECLTGRRLFAAASEAAALQKVLVCDVPALPEEVPAPLRATLMRALARAPADRFADLADMEVALAAAGGSFDLGSLVPPPRQPTLPWFPGSLSAATWATPAQGPPHPHRTRFLSFVVGLAAGGLLGLFWWLT